MRILDENNLEIENPNLELGYLKDEKLFIQHHEAVEAVKEQGHEEVVRVYPNGGKDTIWVIDVEKVEASEAWDEYEDIMRYVLYTAEELAQIRAEQEEAYKASPEYRVAELESLLDLLLGVNDDE